MSSYDLNSLSGDGGTKRLPAYSGWAGLYDWLKMLVALSPSNRNGAIGFGCSLGFLLFVSKFNEFVQAYKSKRNIKKSQAIGHGTFKTLGIIFRCPNFMPIISSCSDHFCAQQVLWISRAIHCFDAFSQPPPSNFRICLGCKPLGQDREGTCYQKLRPFQSVGRSIWRSNDISRSPQCYAEVLYLEIARTGRELAERLINAASYKIFLGSRENYPLVSR